MRTSMSPAARPLGARGSRAPVVASSPAGLEVVGSLPSWWERRVRSAGAPDGWLDFRRVFPTSSTFLDRQPPVDLGELTGEALGNAYVCGLDAGVRAAHGRHYTPPPLSRRVWSECSRLLSTQGARSGRVLDPACGAGALLVPVVRARVVQALVDGRTYGDVADSVTGWDLDDAAVLIANVVLHAELLPLIARDGVGPDQSRLPCRVSDGLAVDDTTFAAVVMNPPYGRVRLEAAERARFAHAVYGHANLYGLFMAAAAARLVDRGVMTALVPTSFLGGSYFQKLREHLAVEAPLQAIDFVVERAGVFANGVLQETCVATFRRSTPSKTVRVGHTVGPTTSRQAVGTTGPQDSGGPWLIPRRKQDVQLCAGAGQLPARLGSFGWSVSTGPLVWNRHRDQFRRRASSSTAPVIWAADLAAAGSVTLSAARDDMRWLAPSATQEHLVLTVPAVLVQRTTAPEQPRRLIAARLTAERLAELGGRVVVENHVNVLTHGTLPLGLDDELLCRLLRSSTLDRVFRCITGSVAVSAYELGELPLPGDADMARLARIGSDEAFDRVLLAIYEGRPASE